MPQKGDHISSNSLKRFFVWVECAHGLGHFGGQIAERHSETRFPKCKRCFFPGQAVHAELSAPGVVLPRCPHLGSSAGGLQRVSDSLRPKPSASICLICKTIFQPASRLEKLLEALLMKFCPRAPLRAHFFRKNGVQKKCLIAFSDLVVSVCCQPPQKVWKHMCVCHIPFH